MEWLTYLLKVSACTALFYALYYLFLQRLTFFSLNRFYLLSALVISFLIPAVHLKVERQVEVQQEFFVPQTPAPGILPAVDPLDTQISAQDLSAESAAYFSAGNWLEMMYTTYWLIAAGVLMVLIYQMIYLLKHIAHVNKKVGNLKVVYKPKGFTNCSFLNYVFVDQQDLTEEEIAVILQHEAVHANKLHSLDKLFVNLCKVFLWFNPLIYLYAYALEQVHEYEADQEASSVIGNTSYANLLLAIAVRKNNLSLVHSFVKSPLKARIKMLFTNQSKNMKKLTYLLTVPACLALGWLFAVQVVYAEVPKTANKTIDESSSVGHQQEPFIKTSIKKYKDHTQYIYDVKSPKGKKMTIIKGLDKVKPKFVVDGKVYSFEEAQKFDQVFLDKLSSNQGGGPASLYSLDGLQKGDWVFWFGKEPKPSDNEQKNRNVYAKYNGKVLKAKVMGYSYGTPRKKLMDGFYVETSDGEKIKVFIEAKFARQINAQLKEGDQLTISIYNASYWSNEKSIVIHNSKIVKNGTVLFDRSRPVG